MFTRGYSNWSWTKKTWCTVKAKQKQAMKDAWGDWLWFAYHIKYIIYVDTYIYIYIYYIHICIICIYYTYVSYLYIYIIYSYYILHIRFFMICRAFQHKINWYLDLPWAALMTSVPQDVSYWTSLKSVDHIAITFIYLCQIMLNNVAVFFRLSFL